MAETRTRLTENPPEHQVELGHAIRSTFTVVLAGGRGSRLGPLTENQSKPAMPFAGMYRIIDFTLSNCVNSGMRRVAVLTQYKSHTLIQHVQRAWSFLKAELSEFVEVWPAQQQTDAQRWYQGTADAVYQNVSMLRNHQPCYVLVLAGDHIYRQDYAVMLSEHIRSGADMTVACVDVPVEGARAFGIVEVDGDDNIIRFVEKPRQPPTVPGAPDRSYASMGIYVFSTDYLMNELECDASDQASTHDFGKDIIPRLVETGSVRAHAFERSCIINEGAHSTGCYWRDVGTIDAYWAANLDLTSITPELDLYDPTWPIWTHRVLRPPAKFVFDDDNRRGSAADSLVSSGAIVSGSTVRRSLLSTDVRVNSYSLIEDSVILPGASIGQECRLRKAIVDSGCQVPPGLIVGENEELDRERFHRTDGGVTLITQSMLTKLSRKSAERELRRPRDSLRR